MLVLLPNNNFIDYKLNIINKTSFLLLTTTLVLSIASIPTDPTTTYSLLIKLYTKEDTISSLSNLFRGLFLDKFNKY